MKTILTVFTLLITFVINAQNFTGKAIYKTSRKSGISFGGENSGISEAQNKQLQEQLRKMNQQTFILEFDRYMSTYQKDIKLGAPKTKPQKSGRIQIISNSGGSPNIYYKNLKEKRFTNKIEFLGKRFLIKDKLPDYKWVLTTEKKNIGNYTCYKATFSKDEEFKSITFENGKSKEVVTKNTIVTTAWYTTDISLSNGPDKYGGLPGLILEINDGTKSIVCTEIILNPSEKITIKKPKKGKIITQAKFEEIQDRKKKEMINGFKTIRGSGSGIELRIGN